MVKKTLETYECDVCGKDGERFTINYPDGTMTLDRCRQHAKPLQDFKDTPGQWIGSNHVGKTKFRVSSMADIEAQRRK